MLTYLNSGDRFYGAHPLRIYPRPYWEFQSVHEGKIAPLFLRNNSSALYSNSLWVFPPGHEHGWTGDKEDVSRIFVFHFDTIPENIAMIIKKRGYLRVSLTQEDKRGIESISRILYLLQSGKDPLTFLKYDKAVLELSILALQALDTSETAQLMNRSELIISGALAWFSEHMCENPSLSLIARRMNCSPSHFRRLFYKARGIAPKFVFEELRLDRVKELLRNTDYSIKEIAAFCGYENQSCLSRAFKKKEACSPLLYRQKK